MNRIAAFLASAVVGAGLLAASSASAQMSRYAASGAYGSYPSEYAYGGGRYGYPSNYAYGGYGYPSNSYGYGYNSAYSTDYGSPFGFLTAPITALTTPFSAASSATESMMTGRSVATGQMGKLCSTPVKTCTLYEASWVGNGCSCKVTGGRSRGSVTP